MQCHRRIWRSSARGAFFTDTVCGWVPLQLLTRGDHTHRLQERPHTRGARSGFVGVRHQQQIDKVTG